jgi:hypothetical protein
VLGCHQDDLCAIDSQDAFAHDSTFAYLLKKNALYVSLGLGLEMPFLPCHLPETQMKVPYRRPKLFTGTYVDDSGSSSTKSYGFHVRADTRKRTPVYDAHIMQYQRGAVKEVTAGSLRLMYSRAEDYHRSMIDIIKEHPEMFA